MTLKSLALSTILFIFTISLNAQTQGPLNIRFLNGRSSPNNLVVGSVGDMYFQSNSGVGSTWQKVTGANSNTGWLQLVNSGGIPSSQGQQTTFNVNNVLSRKDTLFSPFDIYIGRFGSGTRYGYVVDITSSSLAMYANGNKGITISSAGQVTINSLYSLPNSNPTNDGTTYALTQTGAGTGTWGSLNTFVGANAWKLTGNAGTNGGTNAIGTTDAHSLRFIVNANSIMSFDSTCDGTSVFGADNTGIGMSTIIGDNVAAIATSRVGQFGINSSMGSYNGDTTVVIGLGRAGLIASCGTSITMGGGLSLTPTESAITFGSEGGSGSGVRCIASGSDSTVQVKSNGFIWQLPTVAPTSGQVLTATSTGGIVTTAFQSLFNTPTQDSIAATGATVTLPLNGTKVITSAGAIVSATLAFPAGTTGNWIVAIFDQAIGTITNSGTGSGTATLIAPLKGTSKIYVNIGGNWK